jgi:hypothetical protein
MREVISITLDKCNGEEGVFDSVEIGDTLLINLKS